MNSPQPSSNAFKAIVRSLTPWATSVAVAVIAHFGYHITNVTATQVVIVVGTVLTVALHILETKFAWIGVFLGYIGAPVYAPSNKTSLKTQVAVLEAQLAALTATAAEHATPTPSTASPAPSAAVATPTVTTAPADPTVPPTA